MVRRLKWFIKEYHRSYVLGFFFLAIEYMLLVIPPYLSGRIADGIAGGGMSVTMLYMQLGLLLVVLVTRYLCAMIWTIMLYRGSDRITFRLREKMMQKLLKMPPRFYEKHPVGGILSRLTTDVRSMADFAGYGMMTLVDSTLYPLVLLVVMIWSCGWKLTLVAVLPYPLLFVLSRRIGMAINQRSKRSMQAFDQVNQGVLEHVDGIRVVRAYGAVGRDREHFLERIGELFRCNVRLGNVQALWGPTTNIITRISYAVTLFYGAFAIARGNMTLGAFLSFLFYLNYLNWPMMALGEFINVRMMAKASYDRMDDILQEPDPVFPPRASALVSPTIQWKQVSFSYEPGKPVLDHIDLVIQPGKSLGIVGKTASGKTTLVKLLLGFYPVDSGAFLVNGKDLRTYPLDQYRECFAYSPQQHQIFSRSIRENITMGREYSQEDVQEAVYLADLEKDVKEMPLGLDTLCGERGLSLSGGQKQRIQIARAWIKKSPILIFDDSLSAVDAVTERTILDHLLTHRGKETQVIVAHRLTAVQHCDHILVLDQGRIVEQGSHELLLSRKGWYWQQWIRQKGGGTDEE